MEPEVQSTTVELTPEGQIRIHYTCVGGIADMSSEFVFEKGAANWLADSLLKADDDVPTDPTDFPPDRLRVFIGGGQRYDDTNVSVVNERDLNAQYGRVYVLTGMTHEVARNLAGQLRALG